MPSAAVAADCTYQEEHSDPDSTDFAYKLQGFFLIFKGFKP